MQVEAADDGVGISTARIAEIRPLIDRFAVIHDEPFFTIIYDDGEFRGTVVDGTLERLEQAKRIAARYGLAIYHLRMDYYRNFDMRLREVHDLN